MYCKIINASAGTGKTYAMAIEYLKMLNSGANYETILAVTFTRKATFEIKERIINFLDILINKKDGYQDIANNMKVDINYDNLIKSYNHIVKNIENIRISTIDGLFLKIFDSIIAPYKNIYNYTITETDSDEYILTVFNELMKNKDNFELLCNNNRYSTLDIVENIKESIRTILTNKYLFTKQNNIEFNFESKDYINEIKKLFDLYGNKGILTYGKELANPDFKSEDTKIEKLPFKKGNAANDYYINYILPMLAKDYLHTTIYPYNNSLFLLAKSIYKIDEDLKFKSKEFNFSDITYYVAKYITDSQLDCIVDGRASQNLLNNIGGVIDCIMVDEFQDTNIEQFDVLLLLIKSCKNILLVGDPKQAIYSFRGGDSDLFNNITEILKNNIKDIDIEYSTLDTCYRSRGEIINFVNEQFRDKYKSFTDVKYKKEGGYVEIAKIQKTNPYKIVIDKIIDNNHFDNTAIIVSTNKQISEFARELSIRNIKYIANQTASISDVEEINSIINLIDYLVTNNKYSVLKFLRSDFYQLSLDDMRKYLEDELQIQGLQELENDKFNFKQIFLKHFGYGLNKTKESIINIDQLLNIIDKYPSLYEFYDSYNKNNKIQKEIVLENKGVTLITAHKSKGLEYDNVYVVLDTSVFARGYQLVKEKNKDLIIDKYLYIKKMPLLEFCEEGRQYVDLYNKDKNDADQNIKYVAYTRARNNLFIFEHKEDIHPEVFGQIAVQESKLEDEEIFVDIEDDYFEKTKYNENEQIETNISKELSRKIGLATHYFMQFLKTKKDIEYSKSMVRREYGNLIGIENTNNVFERCQKLLETRPDIFNEKYKIYTEYEIFNKKNERFVIDRMNIDENNKKIYIYDYKTLKNPYAKEQYIKQIKNYEKIIKEKFVEYSIQIELLSI